MPSRTRFRCLKCLRGCPAAFEAFGLIVRGFSEVSSEASRSLKTPLAFPCSAVDVYLGLFLAAKTRLSDSRGSSGCSHLWAKETVAKSTTGQQPRLNHSTIDTERVRDACAGCGPD